MRPEEPLRLAVPASTSRARSGPHSRPGSSLAEPPVARADHLNITRPAQLAEGVEAVLVDDVTDQPGDGDLVPIVVMMSLCSFEYFLQ